MHKPLGPGYQELRGLDPELPLIIVPAHSPIPAHPTYHTEEKHENGLLERWEIPKPKPLGPGITGC